MQPSVRGREAHTAVAAPLQPPPPNASVGARGLGSWPRGAAAQAASRAARGEAHGARFWRGHAVGACGVKRTMDASYLICHTLVASAAAGSAETAARTATAARCERRSGAGATRAPTAKPLRAALAARVRPEGRGMRVRRRHPAGKAQRQKDAERRRAGTSACSLAPAAFSRQPPGSWSDCISARSALG